MASERVSVASSSRLFGARRDLHNAREKMAPLTLQPVLTPALLHSFRSHPQLPKHVWYYVTGVTLSALNRPDEVPAVFSYALENGADAASPVRNGAEQHTDVEEQLYMARRMREGLLKSAAIVGVPKV